MLAVEWMRQKETSATGTKGGILADEMGLGKTIEMIATCAINVSDEPSCRTSLVVAPVALLQQWKEEIQNRTESNRFKVAIHHGTSKLNLKQMTEYDFIVTSFSTVTGEVTLIYICKEHLLRFTGPVGQEKEEEKAAC